MYTHVCIYMSVYICEYNMRLQTTRTKKHRKESLKSKSTAQHNLRMGLNHSEEERGNERVLSIFIVGFFFQSFAFHFRLLVFVKVGLPFMSI